MTARLRLTQTTLAPDHYHVEMALEDEGAPRLTAAANLAFALTPQQQADLRWYFEDYLQIADDVTQGIAARIEAEMRDLGAQLFAATLGANRDTRRIWSRVADRLADVDVEIASDPAGAAAVPWELLRRPDGGGRPGAAGADLRPLARQPGHDPRHPEGARRAAAHPARHLPARGRAGRAVPVGGGAHRARAERRRARPLPAGGRPPAHLRADGGDAARGQERGEPYHVLHFDGHGAFLDLGPLFDAWKERPDDEALAKALEAIGVRFDPNIFSPQVMYPGERRDGAHGYLLFENPDSAHNLRFVDGPQLGRLLHETGVALLALNACRSAYAEPPEKPEQAGDERRRGRGRAALAPRAGAGVRVAGAGGDGRRRAAVAAMRYNVYVDTAARFVADLYAALAAGRTPAEAAQRGRKGLADQPVREARVGEAALRDWPVPVVYEAAPFRLGQFLPLKGREDRAAGPRTRTSVQARGLPPPPDAGFTGRDETLLALDRAFDTQ